MVQPIKKQVNLRYFASLRDQSGRASERRETQSSVASELYEELKMAYCFKLSIDEIRVAINGEFAKLSTPVNEGDEIVFIPPVSGG